MHFLRIGHHTTQTHIYTEKGAHKSKTGQQTYLFCCVRLSMRFCSCCCDTGDGGSICDAPSNDELSLSHGLVSILQIFKAKFQVFMWDFVKKLQASFFDK